MQRYSVVIFKNKVKKKIIKKFVSIDSAVKFFKKKKKESDSVLFDVKIENAEDSKYQIALIDESPQSFEQIYLTDDLGRNVKVKLDNKNQSIVMIEEFKIEEKLYDLQKQKKVVLDKILSTYLRNPNLKMVYTLNNKVIIQEDDSINVFSLKNASESKRFVTVLSEFFFLNKRSDCLFITDDSIPQKKYLYTLLESKGWDKKVLYRGYTTFRAR